MLRRYKMNSGINNSVCAYNNHVIREISVKNTDGAVHQSVHWYLYYLLCLKYRILPRFLFVNNLRTLRITRMHHNQTP